MSPTIVTDGAEPVLAVGSPGGSMIITTVLQVLLQRLDLGVTLPQAIAAPRASQRNTTATVAEPVFINSSEGQELATDYGHSFSSTGEIGAVTGLEFLSGGVLAAAEPQRRGGGSAMVEEPAAP
jgi:gamma-glutamyltranspeptidase / glutathione hydrolase